jgi:hypothetical protein
VKDSSPGQNNTRTSLVAAAALAILCGSILVWFAALREKPAFWTQVGGYPQWLKQLVLSTFMPLLYGTVGMLCGLSLACFVTIRKCRRFLGLEIVLLVLGWGMVIASACIAFQNNVCNFINGVPIHNHSM